MCQRLPLQDPPEFTQICIFGLKFNRLATLLCDAAEIKQKPFCVCETFYLRFL
jgi:hypothetical protein